MTVLKARLLFSDCHFLLCSLCSICLALLNHEPRKNQSFLKDRTCHKWFLLKNSSGLIFLGVFLLLLLFCISAFSQSIWAIHNFYERLWQISCHQVAKLLKARVRNFFKTLMNRQMKIQRLSESLVLQNFINSVKFLEFIFSLKTT